MAAPACARPGRLETVLGWLFGGKRANGLADARLEALRRYAVMFRLKGEALPQAETRTNAALPAEAGRTAPRLQCAQARRSGRNGGSGDLDAHEIVHGERAER